jgi:hypothetical protein
MRKKTYRQIYGFGFNCVAKDTELQIVLLFILCGEIFFSENEKNRKNL